MSLTDKQQAFVNEYLKCWNATEAAKKAGYAEASARISASRNMSNDNISAEIKRRIEEMSMSADEVLIRLGKQARSSIGDFITLNPAGNFEIDLTGNSDLSLIKKLKHKRTTHSDKNGNVDVDDYYELELYDAQSALVHIGKHHGIFTDKIDHTTGGESLGESLTKAIDKVYGSS